jgi:5-methylcytosine-specific restriction endonuclease McrA
MMDSLLLNADFAPMGVVAWQRAVGLVMEGKAQLLASYDGLFVRSAQLSLAWPAVVTLRDYVRIRRTPGPTRRRVLARDGFRCQYCGLQPERGGRPDLASLTIDHVVPRSQARDGRVRLGDRRVHVSAWQNVVAACVPCNQRKSDRTPAEAGMPLLRAPRVPPPAEAVRIALARCAIPDEWQPFLG